jgi:hypothetical protein
VTFSQSNLIVVVVVVFAIAIMHSDDAQSQKVE